MGITVASVSQHADTQRVCVRFSLDLHINSISQPARDSISVAVCRIPDFYKHMYVYTYGRHSFATQSDKDHFAIAILPYVYSGRTSSTEASR